MSSRAERVTRQWERERDMVMDTNVDIDILTIYRHSTLGIYSYYCAYSLA